MRGKMVRQRFYRCEVENRVQSKKGSVRYAFGWLVRVTNCDASEMFLHHCCTL